jgi:hypothetical protein
MTAWRRQIPRLESRRVGAGVANFSAITIRRSDVIDGRRAAHLTTGLIGGAPYRRQNAAQREASRHPCEQEAGCRLARRCV